MIKTPLKRAVGALSAAALLPFTSANAADITWDAATGLFLLNTNWNTDTVPTSADDAYINNAGTAQIQTGDVVSVNRLIIDNGTVSQTGGSTTTVKHGNFESPGDYAIGSVAGQSGTYNVSGASAVNGGRVRIGYSGGNGAMTIGNTSVYTGVSGVDTWVGNGAGSVGSLSITDSAQWTVDNDWFVVGRSGGTGTLTMSGNTNLAVANGGNMLFGDGGTATVNLSGAAKASAQNQVWIGNGGGANGTLTLDGTSSVTSNDDWLVIGRNGGTGSVTVNGGTLERKGPSGGRHMIVADGGNANGTLTVNSGAVISNSELWIGQNGTGKLVLNGGTVTTGSWIAVGRDGASASGTLEINGGTLNKNGSGQLVLNGATSIVTQTGGALNVNSGETWLSEFNGKTATWTASGGTANLGTITRIGVSGNATMTIGGTANYTNATVYVGSNASSTGALNLNGGTFTANFIEEGAGNGTINFNGGVLRAGAADVNVLRDFESGDLNIQSGGMTLDSNGFNVSIQSVLSGVGSFTKDGAGELTLTAMNTYTGNTFVEGGTLTIETLFLEDSSNVYVLAGSVLNLDTGGTDTIAALYLNGVLMSTGTWGATGSGAQHINDTFFSGDGVLLVTVPEPAHYAAGMILVLGLAAAMRRRRAVG